MTTIKDVSKKAGVSIGTVSHVLGGKIFVTETTKAKVMAAINELNYHPNALARSLKTKKTHMVGVVIPDISNPFYSEMVKGIQEVASNYDYGVIICDTEYDITAELKQIKFMWGRVDGFIFTTGEADYLYIQELRKNEIPVVLVDRSTKKPRIPSIEVDNYKGTKEAILYLISLGHKHIGYITEPIEMQTLRDRFQGYKDALSEHNIPFQKSLVYVDKTLQTRKIERGYEIAMKIFSSPPYLSTALFATADLMAIGILKALKEKHIKVPEDIAVVGFDDITMASHTEPPLTTVKQPKYEMGALAMETMIKLIQNEKVPKKKIILNTELKIRSSCSYRIKQENHKGKIKRR